MLKQPLIVLILALLSIIILRLAFQNFDITNFAVHGENFRGRSESPTGFKVSTPVEGGYDGQFFLRIALNPWDTSADGQGIILDRPAYRFQRILYPFFSWLLAFGQAKLVPYTLVLLI